MKHRILIALDSMGIDPQGHHGHLEQLGTSRGHPKSKVPTWYFGPDASACVSRLGRPEGIFHVMAES
ncbi:MAG TPA: hypothetical protein VKU82_09190 [Planctomycetaceae bacterium]|nr:hypothetical protein [Planctomycetaceae bacterium]